MSEPPTYSIPQTARVLGVSEWTVRREIAENRLPVLRIRGLRASRFRQLRPDVADATRRAVSLDYRFVAITVDHAWPIDAIPDETADAVLIIRVHAVEVGA